MTCLPKEVRAALRGAASRFSPEDAVFMLSQFNTSAASRQSGEPPSADHLHWFAAE
jgi:hypothetical protein